MKKKFKVIENVFKTEVLFLCGYSHEEMYKEISKLGTVNTNVEYWQDADGSQINLYNEKDNTKVRVVWLRYFNKKPYCIGTAVHEIFHLVVRILDDKGIPLTPNENADETGAYLQDYYTRHFIAHLFCKEHSDWK